VDATGASGTRKDPVPRAVEGGGARKKLHGALISRLLAPVTPRGRRPRADALAPGAERIVAARTAPALHG